MINYNEVRYINYEQISKDFSSLSSFLEHMRIRKNNFKLLHFNGILSATTIPKKYIMDYSNQPFEKACYVNQINKLIFINKVKLDSEELIKIENKAMESYLNGDKQW